MPVRANLAVAVAAIRELLEEALRAPHLDAQAARALAFALEGLATLWDALVMEDAGRDQYVRDCADFFDSAPAAFLITDSSGVVRRANRAAEELLAVPAKALVRKPLDSHVVFTEGALDGYVFSPESDRRDGWRWLAHAQPRGRSIRLEVNMREMRCPRSKGGGLCWLLRPLPASSERGEEQKQPAEHGNVA